MQKKISLFIGCCLLAPMLLTAQIAINEFSAANLSQFTDDFGKHEDWIELYNTSANQIDLGGWYLSDNITKPTKWKIPPGTIINGHGFLKFWASGRDVSANGNYHTSFKINQTSGSETVVLSNTAGIVVDSKAVLPSLLGHSHSRETDGYGPWLICTQPTPGASNNSAIHYNGYTEKPVVSLSAGFYSGPQKVAVSTTQPNVILRYTLNGNLPTVNSPMYTDSIEITETTLLKVRAFSSDPEILAGKVEFNTYFIDEEYSLVVLSIGADGVQDLANGDGSLLPKGSIEYFDKNKVRTTISYGELNRHGQDSWVNPQRSLDWISRDEMGYSAALEGKLFGYSDREEYQRFIMRASGDDNYPSSGSPAQEGSTHIRDEYVHSLAKLGGMKLDVRAVERCVVFLNGDYWGVYAIRERPDDHDYTDYYYDQDKYHLQYLMTWGNHWAEYGDEQAFADWSAVRDFILYNDMSDSVNYEQVKDVLNLTSMIDYLTMNLNVVASDWLNYNTGWWRGLDPLGDHKKWGYILWDNDATFDYYINYSGVPNTSPTAEPCDLEQISDYMDTFFPQDSTFWVWGTDTIWQTPDVGRHEKIFHKLLAENPEFQQLYYSRAADLMNTVFTCDNMLTVLDSMVDVIYPEMPRHIDRWGGSFQEWKTNVQTLRHFVEQRCNLLNEGLVNCFNLEGPYPVTLLVQPPGAGTIKFNTLTHASFPWTGSYFGNMDNLLEAKPVDGGEAFYRWVSTSGQTIFPDVFTDKAIMEINEADTIIAIFGPVSGINNPLAGNFDLQVYPQPATDLLQVSYTLPAAGETRLMLYNMQGQLVLSMQQAAGSGRQTAKIPLDLPAGIYQLALESDGRRQMVKVSVVK